MFNPFIWPQDSCRNTESILHILRLVWSKFLSWQTTVTRCRLEALQTESQGSKVLQNTLQLAWNLLCDIHIYTHTHSHCYGSLKIAWTCAFRACAKSQWHRQHTANFLLLDVWWCLNILNVLSDSLERLAVTWLKRAIQAGVGVEFFSGAPIVKFFPNSIT